MPGSNTTKGTPEVKGKFLSKGAYGHVYERNGYAYKKFDKLAHIIQEFIAGYFLKGTQNIVRIHQADYKELELKMDLYSMSLRNFMEASVDYPSGTDFEPLKIKMSLLHDILCGLSEMHKRGIVHGDIKPGNILLLEHKGKAPSAHIGDLGFVSLGPYSKVRRTTAIYRDPGMRGDPSHDLYGMGILILELFGDFRMVRIPKHREIKQLAHEHLLNKITDKVLAKKLSRYVIDLTQKDHTKRPSASTMLVDLWGVDPTLNPPIYPDLSHKLSDTEVKDIEGWMRGLAHEHKIKRAKVGYRCLLSHLYDHKVTVSKHRLYAGAMIFILGSVFGKSGYDEYKVLKWCKGKYTHSDLLLALAEMLNNHKLITSLLMK